MTTLIQKRVKLAVLAVLLLCSVVSFGVLHSLSGNLTPDTTDRIFAEDVQNDNGILKDVQLIKKLMQRAAEFVSFSMPI